VLIGVPLACVTGLLMEARQAQGAHVVPCLVPWVKDAVKKYSPLLLCPGAVFTVLFVSHGWFREADVLQQRIEIWLSQFPGVAENLRYFISTSFTVSFLDYYHSSEGKWALRFLWGDFWLKTGVPVLLWGWCIWHRLASTPGRNVVMVCLALCAVLPLSLHLIAWDSSRIWVYPLAVTFLAFWMVTELTECSPATGVHRLLPWLLAVMIVFQMYSRIPLMDYAEEALSTPWRVLLYAPVMGWVIWSVIRFKATVP